VKLTGTVPWNYQRRAAEDAIRKLSGIVGITNWISMKPAVVADDVRKRIKDALNRRMEREAKRIDITVRDGNKVVIEGKINSWSERVAIEEAAWSVPGVSSVEDRMTIEI
jgi:osmotically-inducible protein OsmY